MTDSLSPADVLEAAADALFVQGRERRYMYGPNGELCAIAAIGEGVARTGAWRLHESTVEFFRAYLGVELLSIWNDQQADDGFVIDEFRKAAKAYREAGA